MCKVYVAYFVRATRGRVLEVFNDMLCLVVSEGHVVWVSGEVSFASIDASVVTVGFEVADMSKVINEDICLLFV